MRIIGGKDFYDGGLSHGRDEDVVFVRAKHSEAEVVGAGEVPLAPVLKGLRLRDKRETRRSSHRVWAYGGLHRDNEVEAKDCVYRFATSCVWFAGRRYGAVRVTQSFPGWAGSHRPDAVRWHWEEAGFREFLDSIGVELLDHNDWYRDVIDSGTVGPHFSSRGSEAEQAWAIEHGVAIAIWTEAMGKAGWRFNTDGLKDMGFVRVLDTYAAFQELSMFVGGVMARPGNAMVEITDDGVKAAKHGFDKWSFRKMPG